MGLQFQQGLCALFVISTSLCLHLIRHPYDNPQVNFIESLGLMVSGTSIMLGLWTFSSKATAWTQVVVTVAVVAINALWVVFVLRDVFKILRETDFKHRVEVILRCLCLRNCRKLNRRSEVSERVTTDTLEVGNQESASRVESTSPSVMNPLHQFMNGKPVSRKHLISEV